PPQALRSRPASRGNFCAASRHSQRVPGAAGNLEEKKKNVGRATKSGAGVTISNNPSPTVLPMGVPISSVQFILFFMERDMLKSGIGIAVVASLVSLTGC